MNQAKEDNFRQLSTNTIIGERVKTKEWRTTDKVIFIQMQGDWG